MSREERKHLQGKEVEMFKLELGDVVRIRSGAAYSHATVRQVKDGCVTFFRPYVHLGDFSHTGGVTPYVGIEEWIGFVTDGKIFLVECGPDLK